VESGTAKGCDSYSFTETGPPFLRRRAGDYRHFNLINYPLTGIGDNIAGNYLKIQADFQFYNPWNIPPLFTV